jgi:hypothetical protein
MIGHCLCAPAGGVERITGAAALASIAGIAGYLKFIAARPCAQRVNLEHKAGPEPFAAALLRA